MYKVGYLNVLIELCTSALDFKKLKRIVSNCTSKLFTIKSSIYVQMATKIMVQNIHVCLIALWPSVVHFQLELVERAVQRVFSIKELGKVVFSRNTFLNALNTKLVW